jgi:hypothetical protein
MQQCSTSSTYGLPFVNDPNGHSLVQKFGAKESDMQADIYTIYDRYMICNRNKNGTDMQNRTDMQPEQEIIFQLDTSYMLLGSGAALHQQYHWYSANVLG